MAEETPFHNSVAHALVTVADWLEESGQSEARDYLRALHLRTPTAIEGECWSAGHVIDQVRRQRGSLGCG